MLVLSEFAGAAQSLNGSIVVNPWDSQEVADAIFEAVSMPADTRAVNHDKLFKVCFVLGAWGADLQRDLSLLSSCLLHCHSQPSRRSSSFPPRSTSFFASHFVTVVSLCITPISPGNFFHMCDR